MNEQDKLNLITNYFADNLAIDKAMQLLDDYEKMVEAQQPVPSAAAAGDSVLEDAARLEFEMQHGSAIAAARKQGANHG